MSYISILKKQHFKREDDVNDDDDDVAVLIVVVLVVTFARSCHLENYSFIFTPTKTKATLVAQAGPLVILAPPELTLIIWTRDSAPSASRVPEVILAKTGFEA